MTGPQPPEDPPEEGGEERRCRRCPVSINERRVERVRAPVRQPGDGLVVDRERVQTEAEEGCRPRARAGRARRPGSAPPSSRPRVSTRERRTVSKKSTRRETIQARSSASAAQRHEYAAETNRRRYGNTSRISVPTASPSRPLRESVASSTSRSSGNTTASGNLSRWPALEPQVERRQDQQAAGAGRSPRWLGSFVSAFGR